MNIRSTPRKTVEVKLIIDAGNQFLLNTRDEENIARLGCASLMETILSMSNQYNGFRYLNKTDMAASLSGHSIGVEFVNDKPIHHDLSRRRYDMKRGK